MKSNAFCFVCLFFVGLMPLTMSCEKEEGIGGKSAITGKVIERHYNTNFTILVEPPYAATDEDVFIIYGDDITYSDKTSTNYDGTFRFEYLREGNYTIYSYSEDSANYPTDHRVPVIRTVHVSGKDQTVTVPDIVILHN